MKQADTAGSAGVVKAVRFEHLREALGIGTSRPRLSWTVDTPSPAGSRRPMKSSLHARGPVVRADRAVDSQNRCWWRGL